MISHAAREKIKRMLAEDLGAGDITSEALIPPKTKVVAELVAKQAGVLAGAEEAAMVFERNRVHSEILVSDGKRIEPGDVLLRLEGSARGVLAAERMALNLLMRMSGIATATRKMLDKAREGRKDIVIAATRKTAPLLTIFDKRAVLIAGGEPHRYNLDDFILIKDNHLKLTGSVTEAVRLARKSRGSKKIEVEVSGPEEAREAAEAGADVVMLDNVRPVVVKRTVKVLREAGLRDKVGIEASGGIDPSNVKWYAVAGADVVSSSYMTLRAPALDMALKIREQLRRQRRAR